ncbi:MAG: M20/M25/M40 family metallo-hydrolase [Deltaproteobacteria bacterium]|nr:M20/M25/M40 family metallo-hydrolase [Deltaproteobacteria bacterium]
MRGSRVVLPAATAAAIAIALGSSAVAPSRAEAAPDYAAAATSARKLLGELIAADTTNPPGNEARAVAIGVERLKAAGIHYRVSTFAEGRQNLVARLKGDGSAKPVLMIAHIDVVGAEGQDWSTKPHELTEKDGFLYGRGTGDDLGMAAVELEVLELLKKQKVPLARDVILAWTGDEESGGAGVRWILEHEPKTIEAEVVLNEGGGLVLGKDGKPVRVDLQTAEKTYQDFVLISRGPTGHSSVPLPENAIYQLARALGRIAERSFPARTLPVTRANFAARADLEGGETGKAMRAVAEAPGGPPAMARAVLDRDPTLAANLRTTCVATLIEGGTRVNALPAEARATINCRILPDETPKDVRAELEKIIDDPGIEIEMSDEFGFGEPSPLEGPGPKAIAKVVEEMWPGLPIVPFMSRGATDSRFLRAKGMAAYGIEPIGTTEEDERRAHGVDERIPANQLKPAIEFLYRLVVELAAKKS